VTLWDLLFYFDETINDYRLRFNRDANNNEYDQIFYRLKHSNMAFNINFYPETTADADGFRWAGDDALNNTDDDDNQPLTFGNFTKWGIDVSVPYFDKRSKPLWLTESNIDSVINDNHGSHVSELR
jgi:hypothetical protein